MQEHWEAQERRPCRPGLDFYGLWVDFGTPFRKLFCDLGLTFVFFSMLVSRSLLLTILGSESGRLGLQKQAFGVRCVAKIEFSQISELA